jgi:TatD DNase family protein
MFIDTHTHLTDGKFVDVERTILNASLVGVQKLIVPTTSISDLDRAIALADKHEDVFVLAGVHPEDVDSVDDLTSMVNNLRDRILGNKKVLGVGEIGLDFYWDKEKKTKDRQLEIFRAQMRLALEVNKPVAIHMRDATEEMTGVLSEVEGAIPRGQFHCFAGDEEFLKHVLNLGFYVSFAGNITYKTAGKLRELVHKVPLDRLLLETDSPYLSPEPLRGQTNEPANVKIIAEFIAKELGVEIKKLAEITSKNALCLLF